jgi:hypothetical protein
MAPAVETREPFRILGVQKDGETHPPSPQGGDSWDDDMIYRVAEFFLTLFRWDRELALATSERSTA